MPEMVARRAADVAAVKRVLDGTGSSIDSQGLELYQRLFRRESHIAAVLAMMASWNLVPLLDDLPALDARLQLISGGRDKAVTPAEADTIARLLPGTAVTRLDDCGHLAHEESPERVAELVTAFCRDSGVVSDA